MVSLLYKRHGLADLTIGRDNNYNLLRFLAAVLVLVSHSFPLTLGLDGGEPLANLVGKDMGKVAVDVFFVTSGFLVTGSLRKRRGIKAFLVARASRVLPGLVAAVAFCVLGVGLVFTDLPAGEYLRASETWRYAIKNVLLLGGAEFDLPGVFLETPVPNVVNGSLWTLPQEARLYVLLAALGVAVSWLVPRSRDKMFAWLVTAGAVVLVLANIANHFHPMVSKDPPQVASMFFIGAALYVHRSRVWLSASLYLSAAVVLLLSAGNRDAFFVVYQFSLPVLVLGLAYLPGGMIRRFNHLGDYSYGLYLYAFPIQQAVAASMDIRSPWLMALVAFALTLVPAVISWHFLEQRWLRRRVAVEPRVRADAEQLSQQAVPIAVPVESPESNREAP